MKHLLKLLSLLLVLLFVSACEKDAENIRTSPEQTATDLAEKKRQLFMAQKAFVGEIFLTNKRTNGKFLDFIKVCKDQCSEQELYEKATAFEGLDVAKLNQKAAKLSEVVVALRKQLTEKELQDLLTKNVLTIFPQKATSLRLPCYNDFEIDVLGATASYGACMVFASYTGGGAVACTVAYAIAVTFISADYDNCLDDTYGTGHGVG